MKTEECLAALGSARKTVLRVNVKAKKFQPYPRSIHTLCVNGLTAHIHISTAWCYTSGRLGGNQSGKLGQGRIEEREMQEVSEE